MARRRKRKPKQIGFKSSSGFLKPFSHNQSVPTNEKRESTKFSPKVPGRSDDQPKNCDDGRGSIRSGSANNRPKQVTPLSTYNYQSEYARYQKSLELQPVFTIAKVDFYATSDYCGYHVVIPPDWENENADQLPPDFWRLAPPEFYENIDPIDPSLIPPDALPLPGCTDPSAENYNPEARIDDGSCQYDTPILGCTNPLAINYNPEANIDDGSCEVPQEEPDPNGEPPLCGLQPSCVWRTVATEAEIATACPAGTINQGFLDTGDGIGGLDAGFVVMCCGPQPESKQVFWYRPEGEDWTAVSSSEGGLTTSCNPEPGEPGQCPSQWYKATITYEETLRDDQTNPQIRWVVGPVTGDSSIAFIAPGFPPAFIVRITIAHAGGIPVTTSFSVALVDPDKSWPEDYINAYSITYTPVEGNGSDVGVVDCTGQDGSDPDSMPGSDEVRFIVEDNSGELINQVYDTCPEVSFTCGKPE
ncbi:MAG: hypothetical protein AAGA83_00275 [Cyanobacteria bacterium P01_F01_bin.116]